jgi:hypothetical protein
MQSGHFNRRTPGPFRPRSRAGVALSVALNADAAPQREPQTACLCDGEGQNRTADTTIFSRNRRFPLSAAVERFGC